MSTYTFVVLDDLLNKRAAILNKGGCPMEIEWINEQHKEGNRIFDSKWEVEEWVDSLFPDFGGCVRTNVGYATPDEKVFLRLSEELPRWAEYTHSNVGIYTDKQMVGGKMIYKIWVTASQ